MFASFDLMSVCRVTLVPCCDTLTRIRFLSHQLQFTGIVNVKGPHSGEAT